MEPHTRSWPAVAIRVFGVLNLLFGFVGLALLLTSVTFTLRTEPWPQDPPYYAQAYYTRSGINLAFVMLTIIAGVYLLRLSRRGWTICLFLFLGEIAYFLLAGSCLTIIDFLYNTPAIDKAFAAANGTGDVGTTLQVITAYPVASLVVLGIAYKKLQRTRATEGEAR